MKSTPSRPWLAEHVLAADKSGAKVAWLTRRKSQPPIHDRPHSTSATSSPPSKAPDTLLTL